MQASLSQSPAGYRNYLAGDAGGGWRGKEEHGLGDIFALRPTLQIFSVSSRQFWMPCLPALAQSRSRGGHPSFKGDSHEKPPPPGLGKLLGSSLV